MKVGFLDPRIVSVTPIELSEEVCVALFSTHMMNTLLLSLGPVDGGFRS